MESSDEQTGFAHYLVVDLEATCSSDGTIPHAESEIIEIGAVIVDGHTFEQLAEFQSFVRPLRHPCLTEFCTTFTGIAQADVNEAPVFPEALSRFVAWFSTYGELAFCSWGEYDRLQLAQDCAHHRVPYPMPFNHLNLKARFSQRTGRHKGLGMAKALRVAGLTLHGTHHRGLDDARNIARLLPFALGPR